MATYRKNKTGASARFLSFMKDNWIVILFLLALLFYVLPFLKRLVNTQETKLEKNEIENEVQQSNNQNAVASPVMIKKKEQALKKSYPNVDKTKWAELNTNAQRLSIALGTNAESEHPLFGISVLPMVKDKWTEDEDEAVRIVKKHSGTFPILADLYYRVYTQSHNLKKDLLELLSKDDLAEIRKAHLKYGGYKHI